MTAPQCACGQPVNGTAICGACEADLAAALGTVTSWLAAALDDAVSKQARFTGAGPGSRSDARCSAKCTPNCGHVPSLPYDERASAAAGALRNELAGWVRVLMDGRS